MTRTVFDHVPKTAGTSIKEMLERALGDRGDVPNVIEPHHMALKFAGSRRCIAAHLWFFPGEPLASEWLYATVLRDPVDRFLSQYYFFRAHRDAVARGQVHDPDVVAAVHASLDDYVANQARRRTYTNVQARHFAQRMCENPASLTDRDLRDAAIASLEEYDVVGLVPDIQTFLDDYCDALQVPRQMAPHVNRTMNRPSAAGLPAAVCRQLRASNTVDLELCAWVQQRARARGHRPARRVAVTPPRVEFGSRDIRIVSSRCEGRDSGTAVINQGERFVVRLACHAAVPEPHLTAGIAVRDANGALVYATNSRLLGQPIAIMAPGAFHVSFGLDRVLPVGAYEVTVALHKGLSHEEGCYHWRDRAASFLVLRPHHATQQWRHYPRAFGHESVIDRTNPEHRRQLSKTAKSEQGQQD